MTGASAGVRRIVGFGDRAVLVELSSPPWRSGLATRLAACLPDARVRAGMESVLVEWPEPAADLLEVTRAAIDSVGLTESALPSTSRTITIPVTYDGPDLHAVAEGLGCAPAEVGAAHRAQRWIVAMMGFAPGFAYLVPDGPPTVGWDALARLDTPRAQVASGSVAVAAGMSAVYPAAMPGGWLLLGRTTVRLFDAADLARPALLGPGDVVVFVEDRS